MKASKLRQNRIDEELANLPFSSKKKQTNNDDCIRKKKKYVRDSSIHHYTPKPFRLSNNTDETLEAIARFCKAEKPNHDISESAKMNFVCEVRRREAGKGKGNQNKIRKGSYPSFCLPYNERIKNIVDFDKMFPKTPGFRGETIKQKAVNDQSAPNIHVTRRLRQYLIAKNEKLPDFLENINPKPLKYDYCCVRK
ncbi:hypothetical protein TRFO_05567 [Tritrichomonas foetus]|uniref:Uncharacterized protein n=1 Tax=Tritrichomonas foetus TaxID=1144522 RepID=A0A1J4KA95_9EUKA|nr:hypothetical protein TRFO_05567 [Tritrichomonas foetus]|eukprot:OHT06373.1 hypothetical protein TRFO_05567 [Tritrichomonas foetus]